MLKYIGRRLLTLLPTVLVPIIFVFFLVRLAPGDPARNILGDYATEEEVELLRTELGLDRSLLEQFWNFIVGIPKFELGQSFYMGMPVSEIVPPYAMVTLEIGAMALVWAVLIGVAMGTVGALGRDKFSGKLANAYGILGISIPGFFIAILMVVVLAVNLKLFEVGLYVPPEDGYLEHLKSLVMPGVALGIAEAAFIARITRGALLDVLNEPFITTARSVGVAPVRIFRVHVLRLVALQILTVMGLFSASLVSGSVIMESIFAVPGIGSLLLNAVFGRDYALIQGIVILTGALIIVVNLIVDILYAVIDPRVQFGKKAA